ncbi:MAG: hypothetical protein SFV55_11785 [Haliscomenobacter sp.]|uniref:hypothetical protein n=1 Tax=Haliscomenobacter sp. TaxID=2717303 RepID=UPI0029BA4484|nr:hypothetical protein [Haliscomenobacter sp.]MDX2069097.1 hypothetical protein [Haliscomenobacter sp.]
MKKLLILLCSILGFVSLSFAQARLDTNVFIFSRLLPVSPTQVVTVQQNWSSTGAPLQLYFQSISSINAAKTEKLVSLKTGPFKAQLKDVFVWNGVLNLLTSVYHPGPGRSNFLLQQFDSKTLKEKHSQLIDAVATPRPSSDSPYLGYCISPDSSHIGFYSWIYAYSEDSVRLNVQVYNRSLEKQWSKQYTLPYLNNRFLINNCALRNNGEFFLFAENYAGRIGAATVIKASLIEHMALHMRRDVDTAKVLRTQLAKGAHFSSLKFGLASDETLYGIGIWQAPRFTTESGLYILKMPLGAANYTQNIEEFPKTLYQNAERLARQDSVLGEHYTPTGFFNYTIYKLYFQTTGQMYLLATSGNANMLIRFDDQAKPQYLSIIPRMKYGFFDALYDGNLFIKGDTAFFLQTQIEMPAETPYKLVRIGPKGELIHGVVQSRITGRRPQFMLSAFYCEQIDDHRIILTATDNQIPYNAPRTLTFRIEEINQVFKDN